MLAGRIDAAFATPFPIPGGELAVDATVGISYYGPGAALTDAVVLDADMAMYQAKRRDGAADQLIDLRVDEVAHVRNQLERDLRGAMERGEFDAAYQPIVRTSDGRVTGAEALLRWTSPDRGPVSPLIAVAIAEQCGLITDIGAWILERSCRDRAIWLADRPGRALDLSVNVSPRQLMAPGFVG